MYPGKPKTLTTEEIRIKVNLMPPWAEIICPPLQAFYNSPCWKPVMTLDNVIFVYPDSGKIEAVYPIKFATWENALLYRSRKRSLIYATPVERRIPGKNNNVTKEFEIIEANTLTAALAIVLTGDIEAARELLRVANIDLSPDYNYIIVSPNPQEGSNIDIEEIKKLIIAKYTLI